MKHPIWHPLLGAAALLGLAMAHAELPNESVGMTPLAPPDAHRIYLADPTMPHLVDGRLHVVDGNNMRYLGMLGAGFAGLMALSPDGKTVYVATTYMDRLQRGNRTDVVEAYGSEDLAFKHEVVIPPKHVQSLPKRELIATTADGRFVLVQNATPATSVTVVDAVEKRFAGEIPLPGCYGVIPWPQQPRRFSTLCGDGTLATLDLDERGALARRQAPLKFFDADKDPLYTHYDFAGQQLVLMSYQGMVHGFDLSGEQPVAQAPWSVVDAASARRQWRPGSYQVFAVDAARQRLFVAMHAKGQEGSHKNPAEEIWAMDLKTQKRLARLPGQMSLGLTITRGPKPQLMLLSAIDNRLMRFDISGERLSAKAFKPLLTSQPVGETPIYLAVP